MAQRKCPPTKRHPSNPSGELLTGESGEFLAGVDNQAGSGLRKNAQNRYVPRPSDRVLRAMVLPTERGLAEIAIRGSRDATTLGKYSAAVQTFLETGDDSALRLFRGQSIVDASGERVLLLTDLDQLERLGSAGVLSFESIYAKVA